MLTVAARPPAENARRIMGAGKDVLGINEQNLTLSAFGLKIGQDMILVNARILEPPPVTYGKKMTCQTTGASWNMAKKHFVVPGRVTKWSFLTLGSATFSDQYLGQFTQALGSCGLKVEAPMKGNGAKGFHEDLTVNNNENDSRIMNIFRTTSKAGVRMLLVILPSNSGYIYSQVKYWAEVKAG